VTAHFSAFSFVDRITELQDARVRGAFTIPNGLTDFSPCLVAEAVGQLAAWAAMARSDFSRRPVAALAAEVRIATAALPGWHLDLGVDLGSADDDTIVYDGWAEHTGTRVIELHRCVGPMLPLEEFDAPEAVRAHFGSLGGPGAVPGRFQGVPAHDISMIEHAPGVAARAELRVPRDAPFFEDHFPRRPVFPATLLVDAATVLATDVVGGGARLQRLEDVKLRAFISPGQHITLETTVLGQGAGSTVVTFVARVEGKRVATARLTFASSTREE
jgi:3-hydroxymyristoyl/3-hydroxydecanoyl-(acyl carrier protein) dehydratase